MWFPTWFFNVKVWSRRSQRRCSLSKAFSMWAAVNRWFPCVLWNCNLTRDAAIVFLGNWIVWIWSMTDWVSCSLITCSLIIISLPVAAIPFEKLHSQKKHSFMSHPADIYHSGLLSIWRINVFYPPDKSKSPNLPSALHKKSREVNDFK